MSTITILILLSAIVYGMWVFRKTIQNVLTVIGILTILYYLYSWGIINPFS